MSFDAIYKQKGYDKQYNLWHRQGSHMLLFVHNGSGSLVCSEKIYSFNATSLFLVSAGKYHYTLPDKPEVYERSKLFFDDEELNYVLPFLNTGTASSSLVFSQMPQDKTEEINKIFFELSKNTEPALIFSNFLKLLYLLEKYKADASAVDSDIVKMAVEYINENIKEEISVDKICDSIHISKYHLSRKFKEKLGITIMQYILKTRLALAKSLLRATNKSISQISEDCGFSSISYFCRIFKEDTKMTPLKYKKG